MCVIMSQVVGECVSVCGHVSDLVCVFCVWEKVGVYDSEGQ